MTINDYNANESSKPETAMFSLQCGHNLEIFTFFPCVPSQKSPIPPVPGIIPAPLTFGLSVPINAGIGSIGGMCLAARPGTPVGMDRLMFIHLQIHLNTHTQICIYIYMYVNTFIYIYICICIYIYVYICIYMYIYLYILIYVYVCVDMYVM